MRTRPFSPWSSGPSFAHAVKRSMRTPSTYCISKLTKTRTALRNLSQSTKTEVECSNNVGMFHPQNPFMIQPRISGYPISSIATMAGNSGFILLGASYLATDMMSLRLIAMGAQSLMIVFNYYREKPVMLPVLWNALFLSINGYMATNMYLEMKEAERMSSDMDRLYREGRFQERGFSRVHFCRLFGAAERKELEEGKKLKQKGEECNDLYYIARGCVNIEHGGETLVREGRYKFIGEMAFISYLTQDNCSDCSVASADVVIRSGGATVWVWDFEDLRQRLRQDGDLSNALLAYISHDLRMKLVSTSLAEFDLLTKRRRSKEENARVVNAERGEQIFQTVKLEKKKTSKPVNGMLTSKINRKAPPLE